MNYSVKIIDCSSPCFKIDENITKKFAQGVSNKDVVSDIFRYRKMFVPSAKSFHMIEVLTGVKIFSRCKKNGFSKNNSKKKYK